MGIEGGNNHENAGAQSQQGHYNTFKCAKGFFFDHYGNKHWNIHGIDSDNGEFGTVKAKRPKPRIRCQDSTEEIQQPNAA